MVQKSHSADIKVTYREVKDSFTIVDAYVSTGLIFDVIAALQNMFHQVTSPDMINNHNHVYLESGFCIYAALLFLFLFIPSPVSPLDGEL